MAAEKQEKQELSGGSGDVSSPLPPPASAQKQASTAADKDSRPAIPEVMAAVERDEMAQDEALDRARARVTHLKRRLEEAEERAKLVSSSGAGNVTQGEKITDVTGNKVALQRTLQRTLKTWQKKHIKICIMTVSRPELWK